MSVLLDDESLHITAFFDRSAPRVDSICLYLEETCPAAAGCCARARPPCTSPPARRAPSPDEINRRY